VPLANYRGVLVLARNMSIIVLLTIITFVFIIILLAGRASS
jgi:hypothetical protein